MLLYFYPRSPCGERPDEMFGAVAAMMISIHALLAESDRIRQQADAPPVDFYPRSPCGERRKPEQYGLKLTCISIHALLAESDIRLAICSTVKSRFLSTLSLRRATVLQCRTHHWKKFLSTLSLRRATVCLHAGNGRSSNFYPRSPCGERPQIFNRIGIAIDISIHALLAESDTKQK